MYACMCVCVGVGVHVCVQLVHATHLPPLMRLTCNLVLTVCVWCVCLACMFGVCWRAFSTSQEAKGGAPDRSDAKSGGGGDTAGAKGLSASSTSTNVRTRMVALPHHIAPLKAGKPGELMPHQRISPKKGKLDAPWDPFGR